MSTVLEMVELEEKDNLALLLNEHLKEHNQYQNPRTGPETASEYVYFSDYWKEEGRYPFYIVADSEVVGFVLIRTVFDPEELFYQVSEFYICPAHRRKGYGKQAVAALWAKLKGKWEFQVLALNDRAYNFWSKCTENLGQSGLKITEKIETDGVRYQFNFQVQ